MTIEHAYYSDETTRRTSFSQATPASRNYPLSLSLFFSLFSHFAKRYRRWTSLEQRVSVSFSLEGNCRFFDAICEFGDDRRGFILAEKHEYGDVRVEGNEVHFCVMGLWSVGFGRIGCINVLVFRGFVQHERAHVPLMFRSFRT